MSDRFDTLDNQTQQIINALLDGGQVAKAVSREIQSQTIALSQLVSRFETINQIEHRKTRARIANIDLDISTGDHPGKAVVAEIDPLDISQDEEDKVRLAVATHVLENLQYHTMTNRYEEIIEAYPQTCDWIYGDATSIEHPWNSFQEWLSSGNGIYWVNGKAGSGKSTLMRYIFDDIRTSEHLRKWSKRVPVTIATFFFWNSGTPEQKSQIGLLRALLFQILHQHPHLIPTVLHGYGLKSTRGSYNAYLTSPRSCGRLAS